MIEFDFENKYTSEDKKSHYCFHGCKDENSFKRKIKQNKTKFFCSIIEKIILDDGVVEEYITYYIYSNKDIRSINKNYKKIFNNSTVIFWSSKYNRYNKIEHKDRIYNFF